MLSFRHQTMLMLLKDALQKSRQARSVKLSGIITDLVKADGKTFSSNSSPISNFKEQFLSLPPGKERENLIYNAAIQQGKPTNLVPVSVPGPNGSTITYRVMPDFFMIDGLRVTAAPLTAQKIADHFGMMLPTAKMSQQIYQAADTKVRAVPLSSSGYTDADGHFHSGADVVKSRIGASDAAVHYSGLTDEAIAKAQKAGGNGLIAGHGKEIVQPLGNSNDVSFGGWEGSDGKPLQPYTTAHHGGAASHSEYGLGARFVGSDVTVTGKDGTVINTSMSELLKNPNFAQVISTSGREQRY